MSAGRKKFHPALKHGGFSVTGLLPGEDPAAFEKLYQDLIAELRPDGPLEGETVATIARLTWRKQNLQTFHIAGAARNRYSAIRSEKVPPTEPPIFFPRLAVPPDWVDPDPAEVEAAGEAAEAQARKELGPKYVFVEMGEAVTTSRMFEDFEIEERLEGMIDKLLKRLLFLKGLKSLPSVAPSTPVARLPAPRKVA
jgi:hypothetical protein